MFIEVGELFMIDSSPWTQEAQSNLQIVNMIRISQENWGSPTTRHSLLSFLEILSRDLQEDAPVYPHSQGNKAISEWIKPIKKNHWKHAKPILYKHCEFIRKRHFVQSLLNYNSYKSHNWILALITCLENLSSH